MHLMVSLCRAHHGQYDACQIDVVPRTAKGYDGPCDFLTRDEGGGFLLYASESAIGVSVERAS